MTTTQNSSALCSATMLISVTANCAETIIQAMHEYGDQWSVYISLSWCVSIP